MPFNPTPYQRRWEALDNALDVLLERYRDLMNESSSRRENTIYTLLVRLRRFARGHFHFFLDGFTTKEYVDLAAVPDRADFGRPAYVTGYGLEDFVMTRILDQIAEDTAVIQQASEQRELLWRLALEEVARRNNFTQSLIDVDRLAYRALHMLEPYLDNDSMTALTYFRRSTNVRVVPYAPIALIGIPMTTIGVNRGIGIVEDLLAIPHEVCHYLFWNGRTNGRSIRDELVKTVAGSPAAHWLEELFADAVGCAIAGPAAARSMLEMQVTEAGPAFTAADGPHPTPALRPLLYAYALDALDMPSSAETIRQEWQRHLDDRRVFVDRTHLYAAYGMIDAVFDIVKPASIAPAKRWSEDVPFPELYENFVTRTASFPDVITDEELDPPGFDVIPEWQDVAGVFLGRADLSSISPAWGGVTAAHSTPPPANPLKFSADEWIKLFEFGGWTTEGPNIKGHG